MTFKFDKMRRVDGTFLFHDYGPFTVDDVTYECHPETHHQDQPMIQLKTDVYVGHGRPGVTFSDVMTQPINEIRVALWEEGVEAFYE